jgi:3-oxoadipate enol-lactonase
MVGMWLGANAADRIERLALLCTFADVPSRQLWRDRAAQVRKSGTAAMADASIDRWFTPGFQESQPAVIRRYREIVASIPDEGYAGCCEAIETMDIVSSLDRIEAPTLVISGSHDRGATPEIGRELANSIPKAGYSEVAAAHLANVERPDEVAALLSEHFGG